MVSLRPYLHCGPTTCSMQGTYLVSVGAEDPQAMQGALVRVAGPLDQKDRMVQGLW